MHTYAYTLLGEPAPSETDQLKSGTNRKAVRGFNDEVGKPP